MSQISDLKALLSGGNMSELAIADQRTAYDALSGMMPPHDSVTREKVSLKGIACEWYRDDNSNDESVLVYLHGGGYVIGSLTSHEPLYADLCRHCRVQVLGVDYRLAPENPYPAAIEDSLTIYQELLEQGFKHIAIAGDSAGGGLTLATLLTIKERGLPMPAAAVLISPWADLTMSGNTIESLAEKDPVVSLKGLKDMAAHYCNGANPEDPLISPVFADLSGLPPILVHVGSDEILLNDSQRIKANLDRDGVINEYKEFPEMIHVFHHFAAMLDTGTEAILEISGFLGVHLKKSS